MTLGPSGAFLGRALRIGIRPERVKSLVRGLVEVCAVWRSEACKVLPLRSDCRKLGLVGMAIAISKVRGVSVEVPP